MTSPVTDQPGQVTARALIQAQEVYRLVQVCSFSGKVAVMSQFHFLRESPGGSANTLALDWRDNVVPTWKNQMSSRLEWREIQAFRLAPEPSELVGLTLSGGGSNQAYPAPAQSACVVTWRTQLVGRKWRGRTYFAGVPYGSGYSDDGIFWNSVAMGYVTNIANIILTRYTAGANPGGFQLCVWSRKWHTDHPEDLGLSAAVLVNRFTTQSYIATMGSRRGNRGL